ncbi:hypothetical protein Tco_0043046, partial [Tanacetum coccineum]
LQRKGEVFVSFREMITSQLQGKLWPYEEVQMGLLDFVRAVDPFKVKIGERT